jgi:Flp pilus assembly protein TadD
LEHGGDVNVALSLAQEAKQKMPDSAVVADTLGWAFYKAGLSASAVEQLSEAVRKNPDSSVYQYHLGMAYLAAGRSDSAARSLHRALAADPNSQFAANARTSLDEIAKRQH